MANSKSRRSVSLDDVSGMRSPSDRYPSVMRHSDPDNLMACPVCYVKFSHKEDAGNVPLVGPCGHSFCRACIEKLAEKEHEDEVDCKFKQKLFFHGLCTVLIKRPSLMSSTHGIGPLCRDGAKSAFNILELKVNHGLVNMILGCVKAESDWCARHNEAYYLPPQQPPAGN